VVLSFVLGVVFAGDETFPSYRTRMLFVCRVVLLVISFAFGVWCCLSLRRFFLSRFYAGGYGQRAFCGSETGKDTSLREDSSRVAREGGEGGVSLAV